MTSDLMFEIRPNVWINNKQMTSDLMFEIRPNVWINNKQMTSDLMFGSSCDEDFDMTAICNRNTQSVIHITPHHIWATVLTDIHPDPPVITIQTVTWWWETSASTKHYHSDRSVLHGAVTTSPQILSEFSYTSNSRGHMTRGVYSITELAWSGLAPWLLDAGLSVSHW